MSNDGSNDETAGDGRTLGQSSIFRQWKIVVSFSPEVFVPEDGPNSSTSGWSSSEFSMSQTLLVPMMLVGVCTLAGVAYSNVSSCHHLLFTGKPVHVHVESELLLDVEWLRLSPNEWLQLKKGD